MFDIIVLGAGASGTVAAITAKRNNPSLRVAIIESMPVLGKKILATGNGRCNLSNINALSHEYHNKDFAANVLSRYDVKKTVDFFNSAGLYTVTDDEGRIYPMSNSAASVVDALRFECERLGITVITDEKISNIKNNGDFFILGGRHRAKKVILACGGKASPSQGSDGSGFELLKQLGHKISSPIPALVQLTSDNKIVRSFKGLRVKGKIKIFAESEEIGKAEGEILFTEYGLSGIASMDAQRILCSYLSEKKCSVVIDLVPEFTKEGIRQRIDNIISLNPNLKSENLLIGFLPKKIGKGLIKCAYVKDNTPINEISEENLQKICDLCKSFRVYISGSKGFENAQVTRGGADINEFNKDTLESLKVKGLYATGELLDVDGGCGGFNLQWAWSSGMAAGKNAANN
ncbi:MAG: NAD(P)/FAD-dependent oxidoreductase [Clostridia bacterium]|nr:NAD(P)/FAD-dependent oxidoreductase [Clostridia bacterium]